MKVLKLLPVILMLGFSQQLFAATVSDVADAPEDFFLPEGADPLSDPYYRDYDQDWSWTQSAISGEITSASLTITAFDIDSEWGSNSEIDVIYAYDAATSTWIELGVLEGNDDVWSDTTFVLSSALYDDIATGLQIMIDVDATNSSVTWAVTLGQSELTVETVPLPASVWFFGSALVGFFGLSRTRRKSA